LRNLSVEVSREDVEKICREDRYICGKKNSATHTNGVDRLDCNEGYIVGNLRTACGGCNFMKGGIELETLRVQITKIARCAERSIGDIPQNIRRRNRVF
jgi:hypothetical protein